MKKCFLAGLLLFVCSAAVAVAAEIKKVEENGAEIQLNDVLPYRKPAVVVFYTAWEQDSINLMNDVESWANDYYDLHVVFIDAVNEDSEVAKQFDIEEIPSIMVFDIEQQQVGDILDNLDDLKTVMRNNDLLN